MKLGWIGFGGPAAKVDEALAAYEVIADTYLSVSTPAQAAAAELIEHGAAIRAQILARVRRNLDSLRSLAADHPSLDVLRVEGGWSAVCRCLNCMARSRWSSSCSRRTTCSCIPDTSSTSRAKPSSSSACSSNRRAFDQAIGRVVGARRGGLRMTRRQSGVVVPLFSLVSRDGWGIGEFGDLPMFARWLLEAGQSIVQILPIHEMPPIETSPYSAMTAMALDPIYITMANVADFSGLGAEHALDGAEQAEVRRLQQSARIDYVVDSPVEGSLVAPRRSIASCASRSRAARRAPRDSTPSSPRKSWWLDEYALFRAISAMHETVAVDRSGPNRWREADAAAIDGCAPRAADRRSPTARTCSGSPPSSGRKRSGCRGRFACSAICRS